AGCRGVGMQHQISWYVELSIKPSQLENFRALTGEMVESTRREAGVLGYQRFASEDGKTVHACERYEDSVAALAHLRVFGKVFAERFQGVVDRKCFAVFGSPSAELKACSMDLAQFTQNRSAISRTGDSRGGLCSSARVSSVGGTSA